MLLLGTTLVRLGAPLLQPDIFETGAKVEPPESAMCMRVHHFYSLNRYRMAYLFNFNSDRHCYIL